jgi:hypothetical protein
MVKDVLRGPGSVPRVTANDALTADLGQRAAGVGHDLGTLPLAALVAAGKT